MGILNKIIKKGKDGENDAAKKTEVKAKKAEGATETKKTAEKAAEKPQAKKEKKEKKAVAKTKKVDTSKLPVHYFEIVKEPHISEKAFNLTSENKYIFKITADSNKSEIKKAVEGLYGVSVVKVNIITVPSKVKRFRGIPGVKSGYRKAIVTLAEGQSIDVMKEV